MLLRDLVLAIFAVLVGMYQIAYGIRISHISGFEFYSKARLIVSLPFFLVAVIMLVLPNSYLGVGWMVAFFLFVAGTMWKNWQEQIAYETRSLEWRKWQNTINQTSLLDRLFFYRGRNRVDRVK